MCLNREWIILNKKYNVKDVLLIKLYSLVLAHSKYHSDVNKK
jgi:hypothetical protein